MPEQFPYMPEQPPVASGGQPEMVNPVPPVETTNPEAAQPVPVTEQPAGPVVSVEAVPGTHEVYDQETGELVDIHHSDEEV